MHVNADLASLTPARAKELLAGSIGYRLPLMELIERQAAEIERLTRSGWQPIETAPHETNVLLYSPRILPALGPVIEVGMATKGRRVHGVSNISAHGYATHWMPLPLPPSAPDREE